MKEIRISNKLHVNAADYSCSLLFIYLTIPFWGLLLNKLSLSIIPTGVATNLICAVLIFLYVLSCLTKRKILVVEYWIIYILICIFFLLSYLWHPENEYFFTREDYGVINYVLRPDNGIFIYLFLRLVNDPKRILDTVKLAAWPMYLYYGRMIMNALAQGYWVDFSNRGYEIHLSYNLSLGYNVLIFALAFLFCALEEKKAVDIVGSIIGIAMILVAGSRGPFLDIAIFIVLYIIVKLSRSRKKTILVILISVISVALYAFYPIILTIISSVLTKFNISSRFITMLSTGMITEDSGRIAIWSAAIEMIKKNPLGYGAFGTRPVIYRYIYVAHPHQVFLEILVDFGVIFGGIILVWLFVNLLRLLKMQGKDEWKGVFIVFMARACQLLISLTFWHSIGLWGAVAIGVCMSRSNGWTSKKRNSSLRPNFQ